MVDTARRLQLGVEGIERPVGCQLTLGDSIRVAKESRRGQ